MAAKTDIDELVLALHEIGAVKVLCLFGVCDEACCTSCEMITIENGNMVRLSSNAPVSCCPVWKLQAEERNYVASVL
jgi:hypothetical protein